MKIAINIEHFSIKKGGAEKYAIGLAEAMSNKGYEVHILTCSRDKEFENKFYFHLIPYTSLRVFRDLRFVLASKRELAKEKYDLCLSFSRSLSSGIYQPHGGAHREYLKKELQSYSNPAAKMIKSISRSISLRHLIIKSIERSIFTKSDILVAAISKMVKNDILSFYPFPEEKIKIVYNGVDVNRFNLNNKDELGKEIRRRYSIKDEDLLILFAADNFRLKGLRTLINAAAAMKKEIATNKTFRALILGSGAKSSFEKLASKLDCKDEFIFAGKTGEIEKFYAAADVMVQPTFYDPCSLSTLEAMAAGLPVITTICNGAGELIEDGKSGFILREPQDYNDLSKKLLLLFNRTFREDIGAKARKIVEDYTVEKNAEQMILLCEEVVRNRSGNNL